MSTIDDQTVADNLGIALLGHPLSRRYALDAAATGDNKIFTPAQVLGERLARIGSLLVLLARRPEIVQMNIPDENKIQGGMAFAKIALTADPYLWSEQVRTTVGSSVGQDENGWPQLPRHVVSRSLLTSPRMWWTYETGINIARVEDHGQHVTVDAIVLRDGGTGFEVYTIGEMGGAKYQDLAHELGRLTHEFGRDTLPFVQLEVFEYGRTFPDDYEDRQMHSLGGVLAHLAFLNSPYIPKSRARLSRPARREIARMQADDLGEEITFVTLRRPEPRATERSEPTGTTEWKHQWVVSGHYRAQWYPREQAHHVIWIAPYLKGPSDAPLLEHAYKVAR